MGWGEMSSGGGWGAGGWEVVGKCLLEGRRSRRDESWVVSNDEGGEAKGGAWLRARRRSGHGGGRVKAPTRAG